MNDVMSYANFISEQIVQEAKFNAYIMESILISEGKNTIENMESITEGFTDKVKLALSKVVAVFTRICGKFMATVDSLFRSNKGYLEKYKDVILRNKPTESSWQMFNWKDGIKSAINTAIPPFNYQALSKDMVDVNTFSNKYFNDIIQGQDQNKVKLREAAEFRFKGGISEEKEYKESELNMTDMYNFCIRYDTIKANLQKDIDNVVAAAKECQNQINKIGRESGTTQESTIAYYMDDNRMYRSFVYEGYMQEGVKKMDPPGAGSNDKPVDKGAEQQATSQSSSGNESDPSKAMSRVDKDKVSGAAPTTGVNAEDAGKAADNIRNCYINPCTEVSTAKMQCLEMAFKDYMVIIRNKVQSYVGDEAKDNKQTADAATNQKGGTEDDKKTKEEADKAHVETEKNLGMLGNLKNAAGKVVSAVTGKGKEEKK